MTEYIAYILFFAGFLATQVLENWFREKERFNQMPGAGLRWHTNQWAGWILTFGYIVYLLFGLWTGIKVIFLSAAVWWFFYDGWLNSLKKRWWFYQSEQSSSTLEKYARMEVKLILLFIAVLLLVAGCSPSIRYMDRVRVDTLFVAPPMIEETLPAAVITDTVIIATQIEKMDTIIDVRYYPVKKEFFIKVKPDTIKLIQVDTVEITQILPEGKDDFSLWWIAAGILVGGFLYILFRRGK